MFGGKTDHQTVGKTHNVGTTGAKTTLHTVVIGTGGIGNGDGTLVNGHDIIAAVGGRNGKFLVDAQVNGLQKLAVTEDLGVGGSLPGHQNIDAQTETERQNKADENDPFFCCQPDHPFCRKYPRQYSKISEKTQEKVVKYP